MSEINILLYQQFSWVNLGYYLRETVLNTIKSADWNITHHVHAYTCSALAPCVVISAISNRNVRLEN